MEIRRKAHCVYRCMYDIAWIPRYRYQVLVDGVDEYVKIELDEIRKSYLEIEYIERNVQPVHVHMVVSFPPKYSIARVVELMKQDTGRALREKYKFLQEQFWGRRGIWSAGYLANTVGSDEKTIRGSVRYRKRKTRDKRSLHSEKSPPEVIPGKFTYLETNISRSILHCHCRAGFRKDRQNHLLFAPSALQLDSVSDQAGQKVAAAAAQGPGFCAQAVGTGAFYLTL